MKLVLIRHLWGVTGRWEEVFPKFRELGFTGIECALPAEKERRRLRRLLAQPLETKIYVCHDYPPDRRLPAWQTTVALQRSANIHVRDEITEDEFVAMRTARDATLDVPTLILPAVQVNVRAGQLPPADANGVAYLRIPLNALPIRTAMI